ncbi:glutaredoxin family protein [Vogesella indigofera]|uniref:glutaredoxin family protein n=1 Tax=Vogesella indigofera TaxID=45465 RepID=UPI00234D28F6|nr:glutaredoxin [Vogesella indigofera]MDC7704309.1 glutaredoxin [Vogesella indigofera]
MLLKALRLVLGNTIVAADYLTRPRKLRRDAASQQRVDAAAAGLTLYQFRACPFCVKTRRVLHRLNVPVALRDAKNNAAHRDELLQGGGKIQVPCLRIEQDGKVQWLYESKAIRSYLEQHFAA